MIFPEILIVLCLALICYQDLRYRAVYWICFPVLGALLFFLKYHTSGGLDAAKDSAFGISFFALQLFLLWIYFSVKNKKPINLTSTHLGWGDVLFLAVVPLYLSPVNYVVFYMGSLVLVLIFIIGSKIFSKSINPKIPLAGLQAMILAVAFTMSVYLPQIKLYDDGWFYGF